jgi:hypothetical protein
MIWLFPLHALEPERCNQWPNSELAGGEDALLSRGALGWLTCPCDSDRNSAVSWSLTYCDDGGNGLLRLSNANTEHSKR